MSTRILWFYFGAAVLQSRRYLMPPPADACTCGGGLHFVPVLLYIFTPYLPSLDLNDSHDTPRAIIPKNQRLQKRLAEQHRVVDSSRSFRNSHTYAPVHRTKHVVSVSGAIHPTFDGSSWLQEHGCT